MIRSLFFQLVLAALIILTAGCGTQKTGRDIQVSPPELVNLTASNNGEKITLFAGQELVIQLVGNPTTGYTWEAKNLDASMFKQIGDATFSSSNPDLVGSDGSITLSFRVLKTGTANLTLVYHRPWETNVEPVDTFSITAMVK